MANAEQPGEVKPPASKLSSEVIARIGCALGNRHVPESSEYKSYEQSRASWSDKMKSQIDAIRASERLTEADYAIRINHVD
jgi:hypothetical protein